MTIVISYSSFCLPKWLISTSLRPVHSTLTNVTKSGEHVWQEKKHSSTMSFFESFIPHQVLHIRGTSSDNAVPFNWRRLQLSYWSSFPTAQLLVSLSHFDQRTLTSYCPFPSRHYDLLFRHYYWTCIFQYANSINLNRSRIDISWVLYYSTDAPAWLDNTMTE